MSSRAVRQSYDQPGLFPPDQPDLFGGAAPPRRDVYIPDPEAVRNSARRLLEKFQAVKAWTDEHAWARLRLIESVEYYYGLIADDAEAEEWRRLYEAEMSRLDAAGPRAPQEERADYYKYPTRDFTPRWVRRPPGR
ncbi:hypothetical protein [Methylocystis sp.]|uniref:hypothetical protein n=1 Tax=Methylocystis sp. TaxID=1911079 RepID=UPI0025D83169|nr:hypothetical protein [Methylocystis sp.]